MIITLIVFLALSLIIYYTVVKPQRKSINNKAVMLNSIEAKDIVYTNDGIRGRVAKIYKDSIVLHCFPDNAAPTFGLAEIHSVENYDPARAKAKMAAKMDRAKMRMAGRGPGKK